MTSSAQPDNVSQDEKESVLCRHTEILSGNSNLQRVLHYQYLFLLFTTMVEKGTRERRKKIQ